MRRVILAILLLCTASARVFGQQQLERDTVSGTSGQVLTYNVKIAADAFTFEYVLTGSPAGASIVLQGCMRGGTCDTLETNTSTSNTKRSVQGLYDYFSFAPTFSGGSSPKLQVNILGMVAGVIPGALASGNTTVLQGTSPWVTSIGSALPAGTNLLGGFGTVPYASDGVGVSISGANGSANQLGIVQEQFNGATGDKARSASLANLPTSQTFTAANSIGTQLVENGSRWSKVSTPAVSTQATASIAAEAAVRHVATGVCFSAGSTTAPALTQLTVNLRDGATGAGTVVASWTVIIPAATGQNVAPTCFPVGPFVGTTNTAMTLEFSALLTSLFENVTLSGYNVN